MSQPKMTILWHSELEKGWFIGFLEGEGTITITSQGHNHYTPRVSLANTELELLSKAYRILKKLGLKPVFRKYMRIKSQIGEKPLHQLYIKGMKCVYPLLISIVSDLTGRKQKLAKLVIKYCESRMGKVHKAPKLRKYSPYEMKIIEEVHNINGHKRTT